jgi:hypothetical protein
MSITELRQNTHYFALHAAVIEVVVFNDLLLIQKISAAQSYCSYKITLYSRGFETDSRMK